MSSDARAERPGRDADTGPVDEVEGICSALRALAPLMREAFRGRTVLVVDPDGGARAELVERLRALGLSAAPFADAQLAFLFLLGRGDRVGGVLANGEEPQTARLIRRLEVLPEPAVVVTYSGGELRPAAPAVLGGGLSG